MKSKKLGVSLLCLVTAFSLTAELMAQAPSAILATGGRGNAYMKDGNYNINGVQQDNAKLMETLFSRIEGIQQQDKEYIQGIVSRLTGQVEDLIKLRTNIIELNQKQQIQDFVELQDLLGLVNKFNEVSRALDLEMIAAGAISRETLPSYDPMKIAGVETDLANVGNINMAPILENFSALRDGVAGEVNNLSFDRVRTPLNQIVPLVNVLNADFSDLRILTSEQIQEHIDKMASLSTVNSSTADIQQRWADLTVTQITNFVQRYGSDEWLRFTDDNDGKARAEVLKSIQQSFFMRSYVRKKYGIPMGAIQPADYPKQIANFENIGLALQPLKQALSSFRRELARTDVEVQAAFESARNFVQLYDEKTTPVFADREEILAKKSSQQDYLSNDTGFIVRMNGAITLLTGQMRTAEALSMVMRLVLNDIREEKMLLDYDLESLKSFHSRLFMSTQETKSVSQRFLCQADYTLFSRPKVGDQLFTKACVEPLGFKLRDKPERPRRAGGRTFRDLFSGLLDQYENVEAARRQEAMNLQSLIDAAQAKNQKLTDDEVNEEVDNLLEDLFE